MTEDGFLQARLEDALELCERYACPRFVGFLDERQRALSEAFLRRRGNPILSWGGFPEAERILLGVFPAHMEPDEASFPLISLGFTYRTGISLTHRDFLGTLLSCGVKREKIGDIVCGDGLAVAFVEEDLAPFLRDQVVKVGGEGVTVTAPYEGPLPAGRRFLEIRQTVASPRLDAVVKAVAGISREEAARRIAAGLVSLNHQPMESVSAAVREGDLLSIRGEGRYRVEEIGPPTRKGRLQLTAKKYI